jgi:hypothetical protein
MITSPKTHTLQFLSLDALQFSTELITQTYLPRVNLTYEKWEGKLLFSLLVRDVNATTKSRRQKV